MPAVFCIDSCALIEAWHRYPITHFDDLWAGLESLIEQQRLIAPDEVSAELKVGDDDLFEWAKRQAGLFVPVDDAQQRTMSELASRFPSFVNQPARRNLADPWVIALARCRKAAVVTEESGRRTGPGVPRIPEVCRHYGLQFTRFIGIIKMEGWNFVRKR